MKKRLFVFAVAFVVALLALTLVALFADRLPRRLHSSPTEPRIWAQADYDANFVEAAQDLPVIPSLAEAPAFDIDPSVAGKIDVRWPDNDEGSGIHLYGQRIEAAPGSHEVTLPNGQVLRLIAFAHSPGPEGLPEPMDSQQPPREGKADWRDPLTLEAIPDPEAVGLPVSRRLDQSPELFLAFSCSDEAQRPVRWHYPRIFNSLNKTQLNNSVSRKASGDVLVFSSMDFHSYHSAPLRILMPVSYGETEVISVDESQPASFEFKTRPTLLRMLHADEGYLSGSSWRSDTGQRWTTYNIRPVQESSQQRSFSLFSVWPAIQGNMIERYVANRNGKGGRWAPIYANDGLGSINHGVLLAELKATRYRQFPQLAQGIFNISEIPGLEDADNLFEVTMGPQRFEYESQVRQSVEEATGMRWINSGGNIPAAMFPLDFADPATTPAHVLEEYERLAGSRMAVNQAEHTIVDPSTSPKRGIVDKFMSFLRRLF